MKKGSAGPWKQTLKRTLSGFIEFYSDSSFPEYLKISNDFELL